MASLTTQSSPTSLQLQFCRRWRRPPSVSIRIRFRDPDRRIRLFSTAGAQSLSGRQGGSWCCADASPDSFAGWSAPENVDGGGELPKKGGFGGIPRAGLARLLFAAGVTVASLSLISRTTSGVKQHMEPLTAEQEVSLASDDESVKIDHIADESSAILPDKDSKIDCNLGCETCINKDPFLPVETTEDDTRDSPESIPHLETSGAQYNEPTENGVDANNIQIPSDSNRSSPESSAYEAEFLSDDSSFKDSRSTMSSGTLNLVASHDANLGSVDHAELSFYSSDSTNLTTDNQERNLSPDEVVNSKVPADFSSKHGGQIPSEAAPSTLVIVESNRTVGSDIKDVVELSTSISKEQDSEACSMLQMIAEMSTLDPVLDINESLPSEMTAGSDFEKNQGAPPIAYSLSVLSESNRNVSDISTQIQIGTSLSFESLPDRTFSHAGIPAPSLVSAALHLTPGKVLVPAVVDQAQGQALAALQILKVIEADVQPGDLCMRREYARWLVAASSALSRNTISKVYPAMYIENVTELAFDDITPEDPDFSYIQGLAEAGIISSKLSRSDLNGSFGEQHESLLFCPESPLSRQYLISWKMALEKRLLPEVNRNDLYRCSGFIDIAKIDPDAWPALLSDLSAGEQGITTLAFGYTRLFQPNKPVTKAQAAIALASGNSAEVVEEELARIEAESLAESAVNVHTALVAQVEKDLNASFEKELAKEKEKINALEKLAEEARLELETLRAEREGENNALIWGRATVESEMEVLSRLRHEMEEQLQELMSNKTEISFERDRVNRLRNEAESKNQVIIQLQYDLEVERKALSIARSWAEEEAKRARDQAKALEEARDRWERHGIKVVVDKDLQGDASVGNTWLTAGEQQPVDETINRAESLVAKLRAMAAEMKVKSSNVIEKIIEKMVTFIATLKQWAFEASKHGKELQNVINAKMTRSEEEFREKASDFGSKASRSVEEFRGDASEFSSGARDKVMRVVEDCKGSVDRITQRFKT